MKLEQFIDLVDVYGADLSVWPKSDRVQAEELVKNNPNASVVLKDAIALEREMDKYAIEPLNMDQLATRITAVATGFPQEQVKAQSQNEKGFLITLAQALGLKPKPLYVLAPSGGLMAMALVGFLVGSTITMTPSQNGTNQDNMLLDPAYYQSSQMVSELDYWSDING